MACFNDVKPRSSKSCFSSFWIFIIAVGLPKLAVPIETPLAPAKIISNASEQILKPIDFKLPECKLETIKGGTTVDESAKIFYEVISGKGTLAQNNVVCANAAIAIQTVEKSNYDEALAKAQESLASGKALEKLKKFQK